VFVTVSKWYFLDDGAVHCMQSSGTILLSLALAYWMRFSCLRGEEAYLLRRS
jgi:hypothetical protein